MFNEYRNRLILLDKKAPQLSLPIGRSVLSHSDNKGYTATAFSLRPNFAIAKLRIALYVIEKNQKQ